MLLQSAGVHCRTSAGHQPGRASQAMNPCMKCWCRAYQLAFRLAMPLLLLLGRLPAARRSWRYFYDVISQ